MTSVFILLFVVKCVTATHTETSGYKLELVQAISNIQHGDRTPTEDEIYPTDPYEARVYEPFGYGGLTNKGKLREYEIGQQLRKLYGKFLGDTYKPTEVYAYSTDYDRTKMSLQLVLASLYPPNQVLTWDDCLNWIPVSINYNKQELDFLSTSLVCSEYQTLFRKVMKSSEEQKKISVYHKTYVYLANKTGLTKSTVLTPFFIYKLIESHQSMELPLPDWLTNNIHEDIKKIVFLLYETASETIELRKLAIGPTIRRFVDNINNNEYNNDTRKIYLYSAHDYTVGFFTRAHNLAYPNIPEYGSTVILEKWRGYDNQVYVRLLVWTGVSKELVPLKLENCEEMCPWTKYLEIINPVLPRDSGTECLISNLLSKEGQKILKNMVDKTIAK